MSGILPLVLKAAGQRAVKDFVRAAGDPKASQERYLLGHIRKTEETAFGQDHGFSDIHSYEEFAKRVPIQDYEGHRPYIERALHGESQVLTMEEPLIYASTSGTTGSPKLLPITARFQKELSAMSRIWFLQALADHPGIFRKKIFSVVSPAIEGFTPKGLPFGSMAGMTYQNNPWILLRDFALPYSLMTLSNYDLRDFMALRLALTLDISMAVTPNPSTLLKLGRMAQAHGPALVKAIGDGVSGHTAIVPNDGLSEDDQAILQVLCAGFKPNPKRAKELDHHIEKAGSLRLQDAWPDLGMIGCWLGGSAGIQARLLDETWGTTPRRDIGLRASEASMTIPVNDGTAAGVLAVHSNFYEFIPEAEIEQSEPPVLRAHELEMGQRYYILLTTSGGLRRYDINDVVEVQGTYEQAPVLAFVGKGRDMANLTGEKLHVNHVLSAVARSEQAEGLRAELFCTIPNVDEMRYDLLVEPESAWSESDGLRFLQEYDKALTAENIEYGYKRDSGRLHAPRLCLMRKGWADRQRRRDITSSGREVQYKWKAIRKQWDESATSELERQVSL